MKKISQDEFKKLYGETGVSMFSQQPKKEGAISTAFKGGLEQAKSGYQQAKGATNVKDLLRGGLGLASGAISTAFSPLAPVTKPIQKGIEFAGEKLGESFGEDIQRGLAEMGETKAERTLQDVSNLTNVVGTVAGGMTTPKIGSAIKTGTQQVVSKTGAGVQKILPKPKDPLQSAIKDATPNYELASKAEKGKMLNRVEEGGFLKGRTVKPTDLEIEAGVELSKVPGYEASATKLKKYQVTKAEVEKRASQLQSSLDAEQVIVPKREVASKVVKAINQVPNRSLLLQKADPVINNYIRVLKVALQKEPGTLGGVFKLRKILDDAYENARGKQAFGSDKISALDDVHKVARDTLTQYVIDNAKSIDVKASMRSQWNLYRALDQLRKSAEQESGSVLGRAMQKYPLTTKVMKAGAQAGGIGTAVQLID